MCSVPNQVLDSVTVCFLVARFDFLYRSVDLSVFHVCIYVCCMAIVFEFEFLI